MITSAIERLRAQAGIPVDPETRGPVPLNRIYEQQNLSHVALPGLTIQAVEEYLRAQRIPTEHLGDPETKLAGFVFLAGRIGHVFVNADDPLPRRRFTAAHELGHVVLHRERLQRFTADTTVGESHEAADALEREADQFAAELLMPEAIVRARAAELQTRFGVCPQSVLAYRLAAELLVSQQAIHYRLHTLRVGHDGT
jgi:Zn-dependent peptidase ImmA (M78 family)